MSPWRQLFSHKYKLHSHTIRFTLGGAAPNLIGPLEGSLFNPTTGSAPVAAVTGDGFALTLAAAMARNEGTPLAPAVFKGGLATFPPGSLITTSSKMTDISTAIIQGKHLLLLSAEGMFAFFVSPIRLDSRFEMIWGWVRRIHKISAPQPPGIHLLFCTFLKNYIRLCM